MCYIILISGLAYTLFSYFEAGASIEQTGFSLIVIFGIYFVLKKMASKKEK